MRQDSDLASSFLLSLAVHLSVVLIAQAVLLSVRNADFAADFDPFPILIMPQLAGTAPGDRGDGLPPPPARGVPEEAAPAAPPQIAKVEPVRPRVKAQPRRTPPLQRSRVVVPPPPVVAAVPPTAEPLPPVTAPAPPDAPVGTATAPGIGTNQTPGLANGWQLSGDGRSLQRRTVYGTGGGGGGRGGRSKYMAPDTPGYYGRLLAQLSIRSVNDHDSYYGRVFLFPKNGRDYSDRTLFGYNFRHNFSDGGFREFQVGRVQTHGAYLMVTDLYSDGRHSTMGHTVIIPFPRKSRPAYRVTELGGGAFRLTGPNASRLDFNGRNGQLLAASGFSVLPPGESGSAPRVAFRGPHVRIHSVGGNPFLRGRSATVFDGRGGRCALTTTELFSHRGTNESDMFRFATDNEFYSFLNERCPWLDVPRATRTQVAKAPKEKAKAKKTASAPSSSDAKGLIPALFDAFR